MRAACLAAVAAALSFVLPGPALAETHTVRIEGMQFVPASLVVRRGDRVVWRNADVVPHTVTVKAAFDSGSIAAGASWGRTMDRVGRHAYACAFHPGMKAVVVVQ